MKLKNRVAILGNSGSGKSTLAEKLCKEIGAGHLDLDEVAWDPTDDSPVRQSIDVSEKQIRTFFSSNETWVVEGCYSDLIEVVLPEVSYLIFLNPGTAACIEHCRNRPWEPHKYESKEQQDKNLEPLIHWVKDYENRQDEFSLEAHRRLFDAFSGNKIELTSDDYSQLDLSS